MDYAHFVDLLGLAVAALFPAYVIFRFSRWKITIPAAALIFWMVPVITGDLIGSLDPERDGAMPDTIWFFSGWIAGLAYAFFLYGVRCAFLNCWFRFVKTGISKSQTG